MFSPSEGPKNKSWSWNSFFEQGSYVSTTLTAWAQSPCKDLIKGIVSGATEVAVDQPLVSIKNILQKRIRSVQVESQQAPAASIWKSLSVRQLYAGALANGAGMSLITGVQMGSVGLTKDALLSRRETKTLSHVENLFASLMGGLAAAPIASWSEMLMDKYRENVKRFEELGKKGHRPTYVNAMKELWHQYRWRTFSLGLVPTICRDMGFVATYAVIGPHFAGILMDNSVFKSVVNRQQVVPLDLTATVVGSVFAGVLGATVTHPFDTWKTQCQGGMKRVFWPQGVRKITSDSFELGRKTGRMDRALVQLCSELLSEPFKGFSARFTRVVSAVTLLNLMNWYIERQLSRYK